MSDAQIIAEIITITGKISELCAELRTLEARLVSAERKRHK